MIDNTMNDEVSPGEAVTLQAKGSVLVDVRESHEWTEGHAPGAVHVPLGEIEASAQRFEERQVLAVCRSGHRSATATTALAAAGIAVRNVAGGMSAWSEANLPVVRDDGSPGVVA